MIVVGRRALVTLGAAAAVALGLSACGDSSSTNTTKDPRGSDTAALQKFKSCLSEHGVKLPEHREGGPPSGSGGSSGKPPSGGFRPGGGFGSSGDSKKMEEAFKDCSKYAPSFGDRGAGGEGHYPGAGGFRPGGSAGEGGSGEGGSGGGSSGGGGSSS